jgi:hypothetical protein
VIVYAGLYHISVIIGVRFERTRSFRILLDPLPQNVQEDPAQNFTPVGIVFKGSGFYATRPSLALLNNPCKRDKIETAKN